MACHTLRVTECLNNAIEFWRPAVSLSETVKRPYHNELRAQREGDALENHRRLKRDRLRTAAEAERVRRHFVAWAHAHVEQQSDGDAG